MNRRKFLGIAGAGVSSQIYFPHLASALCERAVDRHGRNITQQSESVWIRTFRRMDHGRIRVACLSLFMPISSPIRTRRPRCTRSGLAPRTIFTK